MQINRLIRLLENETDGHMVLSDAERKHYTWKSHVIAKGRNLRRSHIWEMTRMSLTSWNRLWLLSL